MKDYITAHDGQEILYPETEIQIPLFVMEIRKTPKPELRRAYLKGRRQQKKADLEALCFGIFMLGLPFGMFLHWLCH